MAGDNSVKLLILDCDGVLVDSEALAARATARAFSSAGIPMTTEEAQKLFTGKDRAYMRHWLELCGVTDTEAVFTCAQKLADEYFASDLKPVPGVLETLKRLTELQIPWCIASNSFRERLKRSLTLTGIYPLAEGRIFSAQDVRAGKPAPDLHLHACRSCGADPSEALVIDDSVSGILGAARAGISSIGFTGLSPFGAQGGRELIEAGASRLLSDFREVPDVVAGFKLPLPTSELNGRSQVTTQRAQI